MTKKFVVYVLNTSKMTVGSHWYATVDEADEVARSLRSHGCEDRSKYLITVCHEDCGLLGTF